MANIFGDQPEWAAARSAVSQLMERYAGRSPLARAASSTVELSSPASTRRKPASSRIGTPRSCALVSFEPALSPATR